MNKRPEAPQGMSNTEKLGSTTVARLITVVSVMTILVGTLYIGNIFGLLGIYLSIVPYCGLILMFILVLVYLIYPAKKGAPKGKVTWADILFIFISVSASGYIFFFSKRCSELLTMGYATTVEVVLCFMLVVVILEAARRTIGYAMPLIALFFVIHLLFGSHFPSILRTGHFTLERIATVFYLRPDGIFGIAVQVTCTILVAFMFLAAVLQKSGFGEFIIDGAFALAGRWTGGPAKAAIIASSALGTMTGATTANVVTTGTLTIPLMKKTGYLPEFAGAVEAVASNGGQIMPPVMGLVSFLIAELLGMPYWSVCVAAFLPAFLYYIALFVQVHFEAVRLGLTGLSREQLPSLAKVMKEGWFYLIPIFVLIYFLAVAHFPVQHCGLYATLVAMAIIILNLQRKKETRKGLKEMLAWFVDCIEGAAQSLLLPAVACGVAGIVIGSIDASGLGYRISGMIVSLAGGNLFLLLVLTATSSFILGMGLTSVPCYLILAVLVAPALAQLGIAPIAAHLFVFYFGIVSFITPPVCVPAYIAAGIAGADPFKTGFTAVRLGIVTFIVPFLFVYKPSLLLIGSAGEIVATMFTAIIGVSFLGSGVEGFLVKRLTWPERILFIAGALLLMVPGLITDAIGAAIIALTLLWHVRTSRVALKMGKGSGQVH
jgi:TRAP transporter 4TM/12TM fusion protein